MIRLLPCVGGPANGKVLALIDGRNRVGRYGLARLVQEDERMDVLLWDDDAAEVRELLADMQGD